MKSEFPYVKVPPELARVVGKPKEGTRMFVQEGNQEGLVKWFDAICQHIGPSVSPGGAAMLVHATRAAVYRRMKAGKLTAFMFQAPEENEGLPRWLRILREDPRPICYIPVSECKAWAAELEKKKMRWK